ncbi:inositol monophosphatase family protein [Metallosphaera sedula]|uniref:inositol monophosphatase family protein n=1 Tax=Metallosphaera sedula TaxID=43687 RepID=UPI0020C0AF03|nr:inositol monophosphatase family protein [Metallosphaera sedula]
MMRTVLERISAEATKYLREMSGREGIDRVLGTHGDDTTKVIDKLAEDFILEKLNETGLLITYVTEETGTIRKEGSEYVAVIDPLDGSTNFLNGITWAAVSISVYSSKGAPVAGIVGEIFSGKTYSYDETGAYINGERVEKVSTPKQRIVLPYFDRSRLREITQVLSAIEGNYKTRNLGAASLDMLLVCTGRAYLFVDVRNKLRNVDIASSLNFCEKVNISPFSLEGERIRIDLEKVSVVKNVLVTPDSSLSQRILSAWKALPS